MNADLFSTLLAANKYRILDWELPRILPGSLDWPSGPVILLGLVVLSIVVGVLFANATRLRDYGWKVSLILGTVLVSLFIVLFGDFKLGVDLKGGVILVYEINELETEQLNRGRSQEGWSMGELTTVVSERLNPTGLNEIVVRPFGPKQIEIVVPEVDPQEVGKIQELIETGGSLQFMIVASDERNTELFELARQQAEKPSEERLRRDVRDAEGRQVGFWAKFGREKGDPTSAPFRAPDILANGYFRDARTGTVFDLTATERQAFTSNPVAFDAYLKQRGTRDVDVLMVYDEDVPILGSDLAQKYAGVDETLRPAIHFTMTSLGTPKMGFVTQENLRRKLAIIFDNVLLSAPVIQSKISDSGIITGNFAQEEVDFMVGILKSGSMPVVMQKKPISKNQIGSILGRDTIIKGSYSVMISLGLILVFLTLYYRLAGLVASFALALNLLLTVALMVLLKAPFTLPGLAGLVLTVAMSVDANVLISERMREELERGATLRMAIRNGFDKALSAIIDGNLTTFLTALVLYFIGTDQVKGFGMTLMLGNITSMFTAIFCARVIFEIFERTRWVKTLSMGKFLTTPNVDWTRFFMPATVGSVVLIMIGLVVTVARGKGLFDIDLAGGTSVTFILRNAMPEDDVRARIDKVLTKDPETGSDIEKNVYSMQVDTEQPDTVYKVDSSLQDVELLQEKVRDALRDGDQEGLKTFLMEIGDLTEAEIPATPPPPSIGAPGFGKAAPVASPPPAAAPPADKAKAADAKSAEKTPAKTEVKAKTEESGKETPTEKAAQEPEAAQKAPQESAEPPAKKDDAKTDDPADKSGSCDEGSSACDQEQPEAKSQKADEPAEKKTEPAAAKSDQAKSDQAKSDQAKSDQAKTESAKTEPAKSEPAATTTPPTTPPSVTAPPADPLTNATAPAIAAPRLKTTGAIKLPGSPISAAALRERLSASAVAVLSKDVPITLQNNEWDNQDNSAFAEWTVTMPIDKEQAAQVLQHAKAKLESEVVWQTSSKIGGQVSEDTRFRAIGALAVSMLGIVGYVWFRFQKVAWGLAAVAAIAHDALVMLTGIAASYWLAPYLGFLGVEEFKISLPVVAAFLTILGYSVNDTIVIFDRLREIRGKSPDVTPAMLNAAVNQTLGRTIILAGITLTVVVILYAFGGPGIHAFAFALVIGVISGCYSTLSIAAPMLLWLLSKKPEGSTARPEKAVATKSVA